MGLRSRMLNIDLEDRLYYDQAENTVYANLSGLSIKDVSDIAEFAGGMNAFFERIGQKVNLVSNYDGISIAPAVASKFADLASQLEYDFYLTATRYTTSAFLRQKLGRDLKDRSISPHIFETREEAAAYVQFCNNRDQAASS